jgi:hypothetical protein
MAIAPDDAAHGQAGCGRPVLGAAREACDALGGSRPEQLWALSDSEVEDAMTTLGQVHASVEAQLAAVVGEARSRGLGVGQGWGALDWARKKAPGLGARLLADLDTVAGAADEPRLAQVREAVAVSADPEATDGLLRRPARRLVGQPTDSPGDLSGDLS